jgi:hypothetical protein
MGLNSPLPQFDAAVVDSPEKRYRAEPWYQAYMAALFEIDRRCAGEKIEFAKRLILKREIQVFNQHSSLGERDALNRAFHALRALEICHKP